MLLRREAAEAADDDRRVRVVVVRVDGDLLPPHTVQVAQHQVLPLPPTQPQRRGQRARRRVWGRRRWEEQVPRPL